MWQLAGNVMIDNLHPHGMPYEEWKRDFDAHGGIVTTPGPINFW